MKTVFAAVLLGSNLLASSSCLAFLLPAARSSIPSTRSPAATAGRRGLMPHPSSLLGRRGELGSTSSGGSSGSRSSSSSSRRVFARRPSFELGAAEGADGEEFGGSVDIFDALTAGDMAFVTEYVQAGGDCSVQDSIGDTPLMVAVESEQTAAVRMLIKEGGADVNRASETTGETPLMLAAYYGHTHLARVLVDEGRADLECRNKKGETALTLACFWGNEDTVEYLLGAGADPNSRSESGERPGDSFDAVFVPAVEENFFTADEEADKAARAEEEEEEDEEEDIMFDDDEEEEEDIMFDDVQEEVEGVGEEVVSEGKDGGGGGGGDGEPEGEDEVQGPREVILDMLEKARAGAAVKAS